MSTSTEVKRSIINATHDVIGLNYETPLISALQRNYLRYRLMNMVYRNIQSILLTWSFLNNTLRLI